MHMFSMYKECMNYEILLQLTQAMTKRDRFRVSQFLLKSCSIVHLSLTALKVRKNVLNQLAKVSNHVC